MLRPTLCLLLGAVLPVLSRLGDGWGTNIHFTSENAVGELAMLSSAFKVARMDFTWGSVERVAGVYDFSAYDHLLSLMQQHAVRPYWILDYGNSLYPPAPGTPSKSCDTAACIAAFGAFAAAAAQRFKGNGIIWETVNEPNGMGGDNATDLAALALSAAPAFRALGETFVGPTTAGMDFPYIERTFQAGILAAYTNISVHPYRAGPPESVLQDWVQLAALIANYTPPGQAPLAMIDGEWGYTSALPPCPYGNKASPLVQGKYVARMWLLNALSNVPLSISYDWRDDGTNTTDCESNFGSVLAEATGNASAPYPPKPAYLAALTAQRGVGEAERLVGRLPPTPASPLLPEDTFILHFASASGRPLLAAWSNATQCPAQPPPSGRADCGYSGISPAQCAQRRCCWDAAPGAGPQCYAGQPVAGVPVSFAAPPGAPGDCWVGVDVLGQPLVPQQVCAVAGVVTVQLSDGPLYLL